MGLVPGVAAVGGHGELEARAAAVAQRARVVVERHEQRAVSAPPVPRHELQARIYGFNSKRLLKLWFEFNRRLE